MDTPSSALDARKGVYVARSALAVECERSYRERAQNRATLAEVGMEAKVKRRCANPRCSNAMPPTWRNGRRVSAATQFCSPRCSRQAKTAPAEAA